MVQSEATLHKAIRGHPNILNFLGSKEVSFGSEEAEKFIPGGYILLEFADAGDLFDKIGESLR